VRARARAVPDTCTCHAAALLLLLLLLHTLEPCAGAGPDIGPEVDIAPYVDALALNGQGRRVHFETYGCQMNVNDTEIAWSILAEHGYARADALADADVVLVMTCAIRDGAENKVFTRLSQIKAIKKKQRNAKGCVPKIKNWMKKEDSPPSWRGRK